MLIAAPIGGAGARTAPSLTTAPSTKPSLISASQMRGWLDQLADRDAQIRDRAMQNLMALTIDDLPALLAVVKEAAPLRPSQTAVLRDIVTHVFISGQSYTPMAPDAPFLGVSWPIGGGMGDAQGLLVMHRCPGFPAYRMLRDGDLITAIEERPGIRFESSDTFSATIRTFSAGDTITLNLLRDGKPLRVRVTLRAKLTDSPELLNRWLDEQQASADQYWDDNFGPIVGDTLS
jgi:hypothetical protein